MDVVISVIPRVGETVTAKKYIKKASDVGTLICKVCNLTFFVCCN